ncbi:MAG: hypothetical protein R2736_12810 [Solirubrobacterales bacterium]
MSGSMAWASALAALAASGPAGWEADSAGSLSTIAGRSGRGRRPRGERCPPVISAAESVVGIAASARAPVAPTDPLADVDHPPATERDDQHPRGVVEALELIGRRRPPDRRARRGAARRLPRSRGPRRRRWSSAAR